MTLTEFLLARITDDEAPALAIRSLDERFPSGEGTDEWRWMRLRPSGSSLIEPGAPTPDRVLAECDAKRKIVGLHRDAFTCAVCAGEESFDEDSEGNREWYRAAVACPCPTLRLLALPYADHPDYRPEWRP